jgi:hypothetical protein
MFLSVPASRTAIALACGFLGALALVTTPCRAETAERKECAQAYAEAQKSMRATALRRARDQLKVCARDACLPLVRKDCVAWLDEVNAGIPSIVIEAKGPDGKETFDVRVSLNDEEVAPRLDVKAIDLDPGTFTMRFERAGSTPIEKEVVLRQGQKNKLVEVSFAPASPNGRTTGSDKSAVARPQLAAFLPWILGGLGVALAGGGTFFWLTAESNRTDLQGSCSPRCDPGKVDDIGTQRLVGDVLFGAGIVAIGAAAVWLLTEPSRPKGSSGAAIARVMTGGLAF